MATKTNTEINGYKYYRITRVIGHKIVDGKKVPVKKQFCGMSKGDAEAKYKAYLQDQVRLQYEKDADKMSTFHNRAYEFIENSLDVTQKYASGTKTRYKSSYHTHIEGTWIDKMVLTDIHPADLQRFYNELKVTMSVLKQINRFIRAFYTWVLRNEYGSDVSAAVELPIKKDSKKSDSIVVWDDKSWDMLTSSIFDRRHDLLIKMLSYTGMRIGECLALKYKDIRGDVIYVTRQYTMGEIKKPKYNSSREIPMHPKLKAALKDHEEWHRKEMKDKHYKTDYIFTTPNGTLYDVSNLSRTINRLYKKNGIAPQHFHVYRATFCTKLCEAGAPLEVASKILGHKSLEVTAKHYALVTTQSKQDAINLLK